MLDSLQGLTVLFVSFYAIHFSRGTSTVIALVLVLVLEYGVGSIFLTYSTQ
jgi:hypothetical protein